jgi:hypothetical protein
VSATMTSVKLEGVRRAATGTGGAPRRVAVEMGAVVVAETSVVTTEGAETSRACAKNERTRSGPGSCNGPRPFALLNPILKEP